VAEIFGFREKKKEATLLSNGQEHVFCLCAPGGAQKYLFENFRFLAYEIVPRKKTKSSELLFPDLKKVVSTMLWPGGLALMSSEAPKGKTELFGGRLFDSAQDAFLPKFLLLVTFARMLFLTVLPFEAVKEHQGFPFLYLSCLCGKYSIQINNFRLHLEKGNVTSKMAAFMNIVRRSLFKPNEDARSMHRKKSIDEKKSEVLVTFRNKAICGLAGITVWREHHDFYGDKESVRLQGCMPAPGGRQKIKAFFLFFLALGPKFSMMPRGAYAPRGAPCVSNQQKKMNLNALGDTCIHSIMGSKKCEHGKRKNRCREC
jgi:hypothetical protein